MLKAILITLLASQVPAATATTTTEQVQEALDFVCEIRSLDCEHLDLPTVEWGNLGRSYGQYRLFLDPDTVHLSVYIRNQNALVAEVLRHEISHYVDYQLNLVTISYELWESDSATYMDQLCHSEGNAWRVSNAWSIYTGVGFEHYDWLRSYAHCTVEHLK